MPALSNEVLWSKLWSGLPAGSQARSAQFVVRPALMVVPSLGIVRVYLWTLTEDRSKHGARPAGEFKIQLIVENQAPGEHATLVLSNHPTALLGYSPDFGVFVGWEARLYTNFAYSANVQVREELLVQARDEGWAVAPPRTSQGQEEVRVAFVSAHLPLFLATSAEADDRDLAGVHREAFFLSRAPKVHLAEPPGKLSDPSEYISYTRRQITQTRSSRDPQFARAVKREYDYACALCITQLGITEAAHIIPASVPESVDEVWNGVALCPNHHKLFDSRLFVIDQNLIVRVDQPRLDFLVETNREVGRELLTSHADKSVLPPTFWDEDAALRARMQQALRWVAQRAGMAE
jgi:putative restriction endonuclease